MLENIFHFFVKNKLVITILSLLTLSFIMYFIVQFYTVTNNAFIMANIRPVAAEVSGKIDHIYVADGETVKKVRSYFQ